MAAASVVTSRLGLSAAVPFVGLLAVVSTAALPDRAAAPALPVPVAITTTVPPPSTAAPPPDFGAGAEVVRRGEDLEVTLATDILFEFGSPTLAPAAVAALTDLAPRIARSASTGIVSIVGHTDSIGTEAANQSLSEARAQAVRDALAAARPDLQFQVSGRGPREPVAPNQIGGADHPEGRARNRRVTITFRSPG